MLDNESAPLFPDFLVPTRGFEPRFKDSKSFVLPLDDVGKAGPSLAKPRQRAKTVL